MAPVRWLRIDPSDGTPIWRQIEEGIHRAVTTGALGPGAALPSVRDLAKELMVNPNTVARSYLRLAEAGVLSARRGEGTFVADGPPSMAAAERRRILREGAMRYAGVAVSVGATSEQALDELR